MTITENDNAFHPPERNSLFWNESAWFALPIPDAGVGGMVYFYHRPNMRFTVGGLLLWDGPHQDSYDCLYYDWQLNPLDESSQMFDFSLESGLTVRTLEPLRRFHITYEGGGLGYDHGYCAADLTWEAIMPPHALALGDYERTWLGHNFQQFGRFRGTITVQDHHIDVDSLSMRDQSWGPRRPKRTARSGFSWAAESDRNGFVAWCAATSSHDQDPIDGTTEELLSGFVVRDGELSRLVNGHRRVIERDDFGLPRMVHIGGTDELGRSLQAEGAATATVRTTDYPQNYITYGLCEWSWDGLVGWGEEHDAFPHQLARRYLRHHIPLVDQGATR